MSDDGEPVKAVIDTNVFVSGLISRRASPFLVLEALRAARFTLLLSDEQRTELADVLPRPTLVESFGVSFDEIVRLLRLIDKNAVRVVLRGELLPIVVRDGKDEPILETALVGSADYLVTGDNDLLVLAGHPALGRLQIVTAAAFLAALDDA
jgi:putative PIN family toxin of toxin-antitoxin system